MRGECWGVPPHVAACSRRDGGFSTTRPHGPIRREIEMTLTNRRAFWITIATAIVTVVLAGGAYAAPQSSAKEAGKHTIHLTEASATPKLTVVDVGAPGLSPGDQVITTDRVLDRNG